MLPQWRTAEARRKFDSPQSLSATTHGKRCIGSFPDFKPLTVAEQDQPQIDF